MIQLKVDVKLQPDQYLHKYVDKNANYYVCIFLELHVALYLMAKYASCVHSKVHFLMN